MQELFRASLVGVGLEVYDQSVQNKLGRRRIMSQPDPDAREFDHIVEG